jgi:uncharacterized membrane-anchored protein
MRHHAGKRCVVAVIAVSIVFFLLVLLRHSAAAGAMLAFIVSVSNATDLLVPLWSLSRLL